MNNIIGRQYNQLVNYYDKFIVDQTLMITPDNTEF